MTIITCDNENCKKKFNKKPSQIKKSRNHFCTRECYKQFNAPRMAKMASYAGSFPKKSKEDLTKYHCKKCGVLLASSYKQLKKIEGIESTCKKCNSNVVDWSTITLQQFKNGKTTSNYHGRLRQLSRTEYKKSGKPQCCLECGYKKHFDVCHIVPVSDFDMNTPISVVNHIDNLVALCPNHHWEFDNNLLSFD